MYMINIWVIYIYVYICIHIYIINTYVINNITTYIYKHLYRVVSYTHVYNGILRSIYTDMYIPNITKYIYEYVYRIVSYTHVYNVYNRFHTYVYIAMFSLTHVELILTLLSFIAPPFFSFPLSKKKIALHVRETDGCEAIEWAHVCCWGVAAWAPWSWCELQCVAVCCRALQCVAVCCSWGVAAWAPWS